MERIRRSWRLVQASWAVLAADKELLVFPILSFFATTMVTVVMLFPAYALGFVNVPGSGEEGGGMLGYALLFVYYLVLYTITIFNNAALVGMAVIRFEGGDPTVSDGLRIAAARGRAIVGYAVIAATVGVLLSVARDRAGGLGRTLSAVGGVAWNVATFLVVPVLVVDDCGPIEAVKRSAGLLRRTWGEQIVGGVGIGLVIFLGMLATFAVSAVLFVVAVQLQSVVLMVLVILAAVLVIAALGLVSSTLKAIYATAVYRYARDGDPGGQFDRDLVAHAFRAR